MKRLQKLLTRLRVSTPRLAAFLLAATAATGAWAANPTATVSGSSVTISNEDSSLTADNATISDMSGYCGRNFTIPAVTGLNGGTILKITSVSIAKSKTASSYTPKIKLAGVPSATAVVTSGGFTGVSADKITYSFADVDCIVKVGTATQIRFLTENETDSSGAFAFHLRKDAYQFIAGIVWSSKVPVVEIKAEILGTEGLVNSATTDFAPTTGAKYVLCGASGWLSTTAASTSEIVLNDGSYGFGFKINNGNSTTATGNTNGSRWSKLSGTGTLTTDAGQNSGVNGVLQIYDVSDFTGAIQTGFATGPQMSIMLRNSSETLPDTLYNLVVAKNLASIYVSAGKTGDNAVTIAAGKTWKASKLVNYGELTINGTFDGRVENHGTLTVNGTINGCLLDYGTTTMNGTATEQVRLSGASVATYSPAVKEGDSIVLIGEESVANAGVMPVSFPNGVDGANVNATIIRRDGGYCTATWNGIDAYTYNSTINTDIIGGANGADLDFTFTNTYVRAYSVDSKPGAVTLNCGEGTVAYNNTYGDKTTALYGYAVPYTQNGNLSDWLADHSAEMTLVIVATMPSTPNAVFFHMGRDTTDSGTQRPGLLFSSGSAANEVVISYNLGNVVYPVTTMKVPNASSARHVYAVTKKDNTETGKSVITVYLDGTKWKQLSVDTFTFSGNCGVQVGSTFGGQIISGGVDKDGNSVKAKFQKLSVVGDTASSVNAVRLFASELSEATIAKFSEPEEYPYNSPYGNSVRTFTADGNWVETESTPWANTPNGGVETAAGAPLAGSSLTVTANNANGVTVAVNLDSDTTYEALTLNGDPIAFEFAEGKSGVIKATGAITIGAETTIKAGALEVGGATTILDNGKAKLIFDYSDYDASGVTVANPQTTPLVLASMDEQEEGMVTCTRPTTPHRVYSFEYANGGYNLSIIAKQATLTHSDESTDFAMLADIFANTENYAAGDTIGINEDVTIANLAVDKNITLDLGANNLTVTGAITGEGAITLTGTGTLTVPVGTTFANLTSASTKIAVSGTVAKGLTLFTVGPGAYTPSTAYSVALASDVHYTPNADTGAYVVGKTLYWDTKTASNSYIDIANTAYWQDANGNEMGETPLALDVAVFDKRDAYVYLGRGVIPYSIQVKANTTFRMQNAGGYNNHAYAIIGYQNLPNGAIQPEFTVDDGVVAVLSTYSGSSSYRDQTYEIYATLKGKGRISCPTSVNANNQNAVDNGVNFHGDNSAFAGQVDIYSSVGRHYGNVSSASRDNSLSSWKVDIDGVPQSNSCFFSADTTYKFGALNLRMAGNNSPRNVIVEIGETLDEDSSIYGNWRQKDSSYGGTVKWLAPKATFTQAATNAYNVTLAGGGNVYVEKDTTENGVATTYIPSQIAFTDDGGYLTIDDNNSAIAADILGAVSTTTAGVGLNITTTEALTIAAPSALATGVSFKKKGPADLTLTGLTSVDTVTVVEGAGAVILPAGVTLTLGTGTAIDGSYEGEGVKIVSASGLAATVSEDGGAAVGHATLAGAISAATASSATAVAVTLLAASSEAVTLDAKTTLVETSTAAYSGTLSGSGTFEVATLRGSAMSFSDWTGTVALPALTANQAYNFNFYGVSGSTVRLTNGFSTGWLANAAVAPAIEIPTGQTFTLGAFSPSFANAFAALKGYGAFAITATANSVNDLANVATWGSGLDYSAYFRIGDPSGFFGTITTTSDVGVAFGASKPAKNTAGGKFYVTGNVSIGQITVPSGKTFELFGGGTLTMENSVAGGGDLELNGTLTITEGALSVGKNGNAKWLKAYNNAVINLNGGELDICRITASDANGYTVNFNGGTLKEYGNGTLCANIIGGATTQDGADNGSATITLNVLAGGAVIDTGIDTAIAPAMTGVGGLTKKGAGTLTLSTAPTFTGAITVEAGKVLVPDTAEIPCGNATGVAASETTGYNEYFPAAAKIGSTYYTSVIGTFQTLMGGDRSVVVEVLDANFVVDDETAAGLVQSGIIWNPTARTLAWAAVKDGNSLYASVAAAITGGMTSITLFKNVTEDVVLPAGVSFSAGSYSLTGTVTPAEGAVIVESNGTYVSKATSTTERWLTTVSSGNWNDAANWSEGFVPTSATPVVFPAGDYSVAVTWWGVAQCASMEVDGNLSLTQTNSGEPDNPFNLDLYGNVTGSGTVTVNNVGLYNASGSAIEFGANLTIASATGARATVQTKEGGSFEFSGTVTVGNNVVVNMQVGRPVFSGAIILGSSSIVGNWSDKGYTFNGASVAIASGSATLYLGLATQEWADCVINGTALTVSGNLVVQSNDGTSTVSAPVTLATTSSTLTLSTGGTVSAIGTSLNGYTVEGPSAANVYSVAVATTIAPGGTSIEYASKAEAEAATYTVELTSAQTEQGLQASYYTTAVVAGATEGTYVVAAVLKDDVKPAVGAGVTVSATQVTLPVTNLKAGLYYRVKAVDGSGDVSLDSKKVLYDGTNANAMNLTAALPTDGVLYYTIEASDSDE